MYFDDYSTSFQSLYKPMYNMSANYNLMAGANGATGNASGAGAGYPGGWMMNPLQDVGVGQFGPDQLIKNNEQKNNYYVRPIAPHKKKDDLPTILGIVGTALGTAALLVALAKRGRGGRVAPRPTPSPTPRPTPSPTPGPDSNTIKVVTGKAPYAPKYINVNPNSLKYAPGAQPGPKPGPTPSPIPSSEPYGYLPSVVNNPSNNLPSVINNPGRNVIHLENGNYITFQQGNKQTNKFLTNLKDIAEDAQIVGSGSSSMPVLVAKPQLKPIEEFLPRANQQYTFPNASQLALPHPSQVKGLLPAPSDVLTKVNNNVNTLKPELANKGSVVFTTHTNSTFNEGYSIRENAKGADKLVQILKQMQA